MLPRSPAVAVNPIPWQDAGAIYADVGVNFDDNHEPMMLVVTNSTFIANTAAYRVPDLKPNLNLCDLPLTCRTVTVMAVWLFKDVGMVIAHLVEPTNSALKLRYLTNIPCEFVASVLPWLWLNTYTSQS